MQIPEIIAPTIAEDLAEPLAEFEWQGDEIGWIRHPVNAAPIGEDDWGREDLAAWLMHVGLGDLVHVFERCLAAPYIVASTWLAIHVIATTSPSRSCSS